MKKLTLCFVLCTVVVLVSSCSAVPSPTASVPATAIEATSAPVAGNTPAAPVRATTAPTASVPATAIEATSAPVAGNTPIAPVPTTMAPTAAATSQAMEAPSASFDYPPPPTGIPASLPPAQSLGTFVAFAWNNLGMHCYQRDYSMFLILPPYNVFWTQVVSRGEDPSIVREGVTASYTMPQVTNPSSHTDFWDFAGAYGWQLPPGTGLTGKGTSGTMDAAGDHFIAEGVPVVDVNDDGTWDPYPFFVVSVSDGTGKVVAETVNVAPASTEMSCYLCHKADTIQGSMADILATHDQNEATALLSQAKAGKPVLCNSCHADPAMGVTENKGSESSLSSAMHVYHADKMTGSQMPQNLCQACHPGPSTQCLRDAMAREGITCTDCHGGMAEVGDPARTPWVNLPTCESCHTQSLGKPTTDHVDNPNQHLSANADALYRNSKAHGGGGIYCAACHGSPHAIYETITARDNEQSIRLQGHAGTISECNVCHMERPEEGFWHLGSGD